MVDEEHPGGLLGWLDGPRVVMGAALLYVLFVTTFGLLLWSDLREQVERVDVISAERQEEEKAAERDSVNRCFSAAAQGPPLRRVLRELRRGRSISPALREALIDLQQLNALNAPTIRECRLLAERLNVTVPKGIR